MPAQSPAPTNLDQYLPPGLSRIIIFPTPTTVSTVITVDIDTPDRDYYATYPDQLVDLRPTESVMLAEEITRAGEDRRIVPGLKARPTAPYLNDERPRRFYQQTWHIPSVGKVPTTGLIGAVVYLATVIGLSVPFPWEPWTVVASLTTGVGTSLGLHLTGRRRHHQDQRAREQYDTRLDRETRFLAVDELPGELVTTLDQITAALNQLTYYGLDTTDHHEAVTRELDHLIRATYDARQHADEYAELDTILTGVADTDIRSDPELTTIADHRNHHAQARDTANERAGLAAEQLRSVRDAVTREARTAHAKLAAAAHLSKSPSAD